MIDITELPRARLDIVPKIMYNSTALDATITKRLVNVSGCFNEPLIGKINPMPSRLKHAIPKNIGKLPQLKVVLV